MDVHTHAARSVTAHYCATSIGERIMAAIGGGSWSDIWKHFKHDKGSAQWPAVRKGFCLQWWNNIQSHLPLADKSLSVKRMPGLKNVTKCIYTYLLSMTT